MTISDKAAFLQNDFIKQLRQLSPETPPQWGKMSFQHMVEHLVLAFKNANGKLKASVIITPEDKLAAFKTFLMSDKPFRENTHSPLMPPEPYPLHFPGIAEAIAKLELELTGFFTVYADMPGLTIRNPVFGDLNVEEAVCLLHKHVTHHLRQFGCTPQP